MVEDHEVEEVEQVVEDHQDQEDTEDMMEEFSRRDVTDWILSAFPVSNTVGVEFQFPCPRCQHPSFYFNTSKQVGFCHRAECHWRPNLQDLIDLVGYGPDLAGYVPGIDNKPQKPPEPVKAALPAGCWPVATMKDGKLVGDQVATETLFQRDISPSLAFAHKIHCNWDWIYIPVFEKDELVQYVGRRIDRGHPMNPFDLSQLEDARRYDYISGISIGNFLYNWDYLKEKREITLVENTFNSIIYTAHYFNCTSTFGSHLSDRQVELIVKSRAKTVVVLWDEGANYSKAVKKLRAAGIKAGAIEIQGQPDDHPYFNVASAVDRAHERLRSGAYSDDHIPFVGHLNDL